jgi:phosphopantetheinyl transferase
MTTIQEYRDFTSNKYSNLARLESARMYALAVIERYSRERWEAGHISAFEYLRLTEQWTNEDLHEIVQAVGNGNIEFITQAEA